MAKQTGDYKITGTYDDVTYYKMDGQYYARKKSRLSRERVKRAKEFARTMEWARRLALGSQLASRVYRSLSRNDQVYALFCRLKSAAMQALKEGREVAKVKCLLERIAGIKNKVERMKYEGERMKEEKKRGRQRGVERSNRQRRTRNRVVMPLVMDARGRLKKKAAATPHAPALAHAP